MGAQLESILSKLQDVTQYGDRRFKARCPCHKDDKASLSVSESLDGIVLVKCFAGCEFKDIIAALGIDAKDLFPPKQRTSKPKNTKKIVATYDYLDESGSLLFQKLRYEPKDFRIRRPDGAGNWKWGLSDCRRVLYHLPELIQAVKNGEMVFIVEGEKDADNLKKLGLTATTNFDGAGKWNKEYNQFLSGAKVAILPDNDEPGQEHAQLVARSLSGIASSIKILNLPNLPEKGDVSDWLEVGGTKEQLLSFIEECNEWKPEKQSIQKAILFSEKLKDCPKEMSEHKKPPFWEIDEESGVWRQSDKEGFVCACPVPVGISRRLVNIDTGIEKTEIAFLRDNQWNRLVCDNSQLLSNQGCINLANYGLPITGANAREFIKYLTKYLESNLHLIKRVRSIGRLGWADEDHFVLGTTPEIVLDTEMNFNCNSYHESGNFDEWQNMATVVRNKFPLARMALSAAFAAPLLISLGQRVFLIHLWGPSRGGKTAAQKFALSVWGDPDGLLISFNATLTGLERLAGFHCDLPLGIDERQVVGDRQGFVEGLVYLLGLGKGRVRGAKNGGLQHTASWRSIILTSGEQPLSVNSSTAGIKTRAVELYGKPIHDETFSRKLHSLAGQHFGFAGPLFIERLIQTDKNWLKRTYETLISNLNGIHADKIGAHITALACVAMGDLLSSQWVFGLPAEQAAAEAISLIEKIFIELESAADADDATRAYDYVESFFLQNSDRFQSNFSNLPRLGFFDANHVFFYPNALEQILKDGGFNPDRILRDWRTQEWILVEHRSGEKWPRTKIRKTDPYNKGTQTLFYGVKRGITSRTAA